MVLFFYQKVLQRDEKGLKMDQTLLECCLLITLTRFVLQKKLRIWMLSPRPSVQTDFYGQVFVLMVTERNSQSGKKVLFFFIIEGYKGIRKGQQLTKNGLKYVCFCCNQISPILLTPKTCLFCCKVQCSDQKAAQTTESC